MTLQTVKEGFCFGQDIATFLLEYQKLDNYRSVN